MIGTCYRAHAIDCPIGSISVHTYIITKPVRSLSELGGERGRRGMRIRVWLLAFLERTEETQHRETFIVARFMTRSSSLSLRDYFTLCGNASHMKREEERGKAYSVLSPPISHSFLPSLPLLLSPPERTNDENFLVTSYRVDKKEFEDVRPTDRRTTTSVWPERKNGKVSERTRTSFLILVPL